MSEKMKDSVKINGEVIGVDFSKRSVDNDPHVMMTIYTGEDEMWIKAVALDSAWIDDFITVLTKAKEHMEENFEKLEDGYGYVYRSEKPLNRLKIN